MVWGREGDTECWSRDEVRGWWNWKATESTHNLAFFSSPSLSLLAYPRESFLSIFPPAISGTVSTNTTQTTPVAQGLRVVHAKVPKTILLPSSCRFKPLLADRQLLDPYIHLKLHHLPSHSPAGFDNTVGTTPRPSMRGRCPDQSTVVRLSHWENHQESRRETGRRRGYEGPTQLTAPVEGQLRLPAEGARDQSRKCCRISRRLLFIAGVSPGNRPYTFWAGYLATLYGRAACRVRHLAANGAKAPPIWKIGRCRNTAIAWNGIYEGVCRTLLSAPLSGDSASPLLPRRPLTGVMRI